MGLGRCRRAMLSGQCHELIGRYIQRHVGKRARCLWRFGGLVVWWFGVWG